MDDIVQQIAANYAKHEAEPNVATSTTIGALFVLMQDYTSAINWYEHAFDMGGRVDSTLEKIINGLKLRSNSDSN